MAKPPRPSKDTLTPPEVHILLALVDGDRHGLGIADHVQRFTNGRIVMGPGTLYGAIKRLLDADLIVDAPARPAQAADDPRRRYYRLTLLGRRAVESEARAMAQVVSVARLKRVLR
jgi:DNA-binding PadR family transcriptional regulator